MARDSVKIRIDGDTSGFEKALSSIEKGAKKTVSIIAKGTAVVGAGFGAATVAALNFSGELEQNLGGSEAVFKEYANEIQTTAQKAFKNMGLSTSDYLATANKMGALFKGAGFDIKEVADKTTAAMQRASDIASIMGIDVSMAMESVAGMAKGNFTMMDNLGVAMNDTTLNAYALEIGLGKTTAQMTNQEKVALALEMFLDRTAYAAGNYAKENDTLAGSLTTAKAALQNFISGTGSVDEVVESLTNAGEVIIDNLGELVPKLVSGSGELVEKLMGQLVQMITDNAPQMIEAAVDIIYAFVTGLGQNSGQIAHAALVIMQVLIEGLIRLMPEIVAVAKQVISAFAEELKNAYPILTPLANIIEILANNIETLTIATLAGVAAWKTVAIVQKVTKWYKATKIVLNQYTAAITANTLSQQMGATSNVLLLSTMKPLEILMGLLIGKIKAQTVATYALAAAKKALSGATGLVIAGITAVVAGVAAYVSSQKRAKEATEETTESVKEQDKVINDSAATKLAEIKTVENLRSKLYELANQINSNALTEEEAVKKQAEFNATANELNSIIPGITSNISTETGEIVIQTNAIENLISSYKRLAKAQAYAEAYKEKMTEAAKKAIEAETTIETAQQKMKDFGVVTQAVEEVSLMGAGAQTIYPVVYRDENGNDITEQYTKAQKDIQQAQKDAKKYNEEADSYADKYISQLGELGDTAEETGDKVNKVVTNVTDTVKDETSKQETAIKKSLKEELEYLEEMHKLGFISDKDYYDRLADVRDRYFEEGSEDWESYTEEIEDYYTETIKNLKDKMDNFAQKLQDDTNKTYATITLDADGEVKTWHTLADMDTQNAQLEDYLSMLNQIKETRGEIPREALENLQSMSTEDALQFLKVMLNASDAEWNKWVSGLEENKKLAEQVSQEVYADEIEQNQELIQKIIDEWGEVPEDFFKIGEDCAEKYGEGFKNVLEGIGKELGSIVEAQLSYLPSATIDYNIYANGGGGTNNYYDNRSTTYNLPSSSPRAQIEAQKQNNIYQAHTSTFGG